MPAGGGAVLLDGDALAARMREALAARAAALAARGVVARMATVLVGGDPASAAYIGRKHADCAAVGIASDDIRLPGDIGQAALLAEVARLNADPGLHGLLVQLPLPGGLDGAAVTAAVLPARDIDGLHPVNLGRLLAGQPGIRPCTPLGILHLLRAHGVDLAGRRVAILGRGLLVGRPLAMLLSLPGVDATVTLLHRGSGDPGAVTRAADVVISAAGRPGLVTAAMVRPGAAVVGVGISWGPQGGMVSDIAADVAGVAGWITPPHGSVGALTRAFLLSNLLDAAEARG
jgi:methylenetetrahydrofolate dehydrogenase (NADP+)/methenyltetrahydrofolate cyclohydrolase